METNVVINLITVQACFDSHEQVWVAVGCLYHPTADGVAILCTDGKDKELLKDMAIGLQEKVDELRILQGQEVK